MEHTRIKKLSRVLTLLLALVLLLAPFAQALTLDQARELLAEFYVDPIPEETLQQPTIEDIILALGDPYTQYMTPEEYAGFIGSMSDQVVVGIGITVEKADLGLVITGVFSDSSAARAGLAAGDSILSVDGKTTAGQDADVAASWIRGEEGTLVTVRILHADGTEQNYVLTRKPVIIPTTSAQEVDGHICYIVCDAFGSETQQHFQDILDIYGEETDHYILDLRSNLGGDIAAAVNSLGLFLGSGDMVYLRDGAGDYYRFTADSASQVMYPVILLSSEWTASSSEIFASAMRDYDAGFVVGSRTYGKGVAQILLNQEELPDYFSDGSALKITAYRYFSPQGNTADQIGVIPNLLVSDLSSAAVAWLISLTDPGSANKGVIRIKMASWWWYMDPDAAATEELKPAFAELLEALPPDTEVYMGLGNEKWESVTPAELAEDYGLEYTARTFSDLDGSDYELEINTLRTFGLVKGCDDGLYHPKKVLTRAELCALIAQILNCKQTGTAAPFADVPESAWYAPYVSEVYSLGLVEGSGDGLFHPNDVLDHEQFITIMARLAAWLNLKFYQSEKAGPDDGVLDDASLSAYSDWAKRSVWLLGKSQKNLLGGEYNLLFAPVAEISPAGATLREEAAGLVYSILTYTGILTD